MSDELTMFRVPVVMFTETRGVDERDAVRRAEAMLAGTDSGFSRWRDAMRAMKIHGVVVVGVQELNGALRGHEFVVQVNDTGPTFRGRD